MTLVFTPFLCIKKLAGKKTHIATQFDQTRTVDNPHSATKKCQLQPSFNWFNSHCKAFFSQFLSVSCDFPRGVQLNQTQRLPNPSDPGFTRGEPVRVTRVTRVLCSEQLLTFHLQGVAVQGEDCTFWQATLLEQEIFSGGVRWGYHLFWEGVNLKNNKCT